MRLWDFIEDAMRQNPDQIICENDACMSYDDVVAYAEVFADKIKSEKCCAVMCNSEMAEAIAVLACFAANVTAVPLSLRYGEQHCRRLIEFISPTALITDLDNGLKAYRFATHNYTESDEHPALIMCTSGTTGTPKGVMLSEKNIMCNVSDISEYFDILKKDTILISRPLYHAAVLTGEFLTALVKGAKICFSSEKFNPFALLKKIREKNITVFCGTPTIMSAISRCVKSFDVELRNICISGECLAPSVAEMMIDAFPEAKIYHVYGLTEACPRVSYLPPEQFRENNTYVGIPLKSVKLKILKNDGSAASVGEDGILWVSGDNVMMGYYQNEEQTSLVLKDGWLCTKDIARIDENGFLKIIGRSDDMIIRAGMNIYPQEIETVLKSDQRVKEVYVYGVKNKILGQDIAMKISGDFSGEEEVRKLCRKLLPEYQIPSLIELRDKLSQTPTGKILRTK